MNLRKITHPHSIGFMLIALIFLLTLSACGARSERDPLELQTFLSVMEEKGFQIIDYTGELTGDLEAHVSLYLIAVSPTGSFQVEFIECHTVAGARAVFVGTRQNVEALRGSASSHRSVDGPNHSSYSQTSGGVYSRLLRVDNIVVIVLGADSGYRDEIRNIFDIIS